jgi:hypothetical protein
LAWFRINSACVLHNLVIRIVIHVRNYESHVQFTDWCAPVKISNRVEYTVLQALQFHGVSVRRILPGGTGISHIWPNQSFAKSKFNICT